MGFTSLFTFIYSPREGTPAAKLDDPVTHAEKARWLGELLKVQEGIAAERTAASLGRTYRVLCEEHHDDGTVFGRTEANIGITFPADGSVVGRFAQVRVTKALNWVLEGEAVSFE